MEEGLVARMVQAGIRAMTPHQREQAERFGVEVITAQRWDQAAAIDFSGPVYLSLDMDVLDPAFAPGVSHHEPGGLSTRDVLDLIHALHAKLVGADIVEYNPKRDPVGITAMAAVKLLKEIAERLLE
jgi:arginase family enzyme